MSNDTKIGLDLTEIQTPENLKITQICTSDSSFVRTHRAESNDTKINVIGKDLTKYNIK